MNEIRRLFLLEDLEKLNKYASAYVNHVTDDDRSTLSAHEPSYRDQPDQERTKRRFLLRWVEEHRKKTRRVPTWTTEFTSRRMRTAVERCIKQMCPQVTIARGLEDKLAELLQQKHLQCIGFSLDDEVLVLKSQKDAPVQDGRTVLKLWEYIIYPKHPLNPFDSSRELDEDEDAAEYEDGINYPDVDDEESDEADEDEL